MILKGSVFSNTLNMETGITVLVPNRLKSDGAYKIVYLLHGLCGNSGDWINYTMLPNYAEDYDAIIVMPEVARSFYTDMKYGLKYFSYIVEELPQICNRIFRISSKREDTIVIGASMGGYGALKCVLTRPDQYGACGAFSSACLFLKEGLDAQRQDPETAKAIFGEQLVNDFYAAFGETLDWNPENEILELAKKQSGKEQNPTIYCACGTEDPFLELNRRFASDMNEAELNFKYEEWEGGHNWYFFDQAIKKAFQKLL